MELNSAEGSSRQNDRLADAASASGPGPQESSETDADKVPGLPLTSLSVFFPALNESGNIQRVVETAIACFCRLTELLEVIVVDDGSTDDTPSIVGRLADTDPRVRLVQHSRNRGYGAALRSGFAAARYDFVFFSDGDGQFDLAEITRLVPLLQNSDLATGYRIARSDPWYRLVNARLYHLLIRLMFGLNMHDVDCAFKLMRREVLQSVQLQSEGALISAELLVRTRNAGFRISETGVHHFPRVWGQASGASVRVILRMFSELFRFKLRLRQEQRAARGRSAPDV